MPTRKHLQSLATATSFSRGRGYFRAGSVGKTTYTSDLFPARVHGPHLHKVQFFVTILHLLPLLLVGCQPAPPKQTAAAGSPRPAESLHPLPRLFVTGNFDGDQRPDTLYQCVFSDLTKTEIARGPAPSQPFQDEPDAAVGWFAKRRAEVLLTLGRPARDTLRLGFGQGLYCLLNLGDTNSDGRDEVALVVDYLDGSRVNSCQLLALCQGKLTIRNQFGIQEGAFDEAATPPATIPGFLVKRRGHWFYTDYLEDAAADSPAAEGQLKRLSIPPCP
jgi:hypothetical protein